MKDVAHHMNKFIKKIKPEISEKETEELLRKNLNVEESRKEKRKKEKIEMRKGREDHIPVHKSDEERNREKKRNCPIHLPSKPTSVKSRG